MCRPVQTSVSSGGFLFLSSFILMSSVKVSVYPTRLWGNVAWHEMEGAKGKVKPRHPTPWCVVLVLCWYPSCSVVVAHFPG